MGVEVILRLYALRTIRNEKPRSRLCASAIAMALRRASPPGALLAGRSVTKKLFSKLTVGRRSL